MKKAILILPPLLCLLAKLGNLEAHFAQPSFLWVGLLTFWLVLWWIGEAMPFGITALIPILYLPLTQVVKLKEVCAHYGNPVIFLFLGGMLVAIALEKTRLSERIALTIIKFTGKSDRGILCGHILATTLISMWISNTATTMIMVPIAVSVLEFIKREQGDSKDYQKFAGALLLSIAFSATIGGILSPVGTPPNVVFLGYLKEMFDLKIYFHQWFMATLPIAASFLIVMYFLMTKITHPFRLPLGADFRQVTQKMLHELGPMNRAQKYTSAVFFLVGFLWIFHYPLTLLFKHELLDDSQVAILGGVLLFIFPLDKKNGPILVKEDLNKISWNILLLFGGGMALAASYEASGLLPYAVDWLKTLPLTSPLVVVAIFAALLVFISEFASNVALCNVAMPFILTFCQSKGFSIKEVGLLCAVATSFGFALPVATPPNTIAFGTGQIKIQDMLKLGIMLDVVGVGLIVLAGLYLL